MTNESGTFKSAGLYWLALGAFAVGTEGFMIAGILPRLATDLSVSPGTTGYLATAFAFAYAVSKCRDLRREGRRRLLAVARNRGHHYAVVMEDTGSIHLHRNLTSLRAKGRINHCGMDADE